MSIAGQITDDLLSKAEKLIYDGEYASKMIFAQRANTDPYLA